jgi:hypothetical protein
MSAPALIVISTVFLLCLGGISFQLVWRPIQHFLLLRSEIIGRTERFRRERERWKATEGRGSPSDQATRRVQDTEIELRLRKAQLEFRHLAEQINIFVASEPIASRILRIFRYDPVEAETSVSNLADAIALERGEYRSGKSEICTTSTYVA